MTNEVQYISNHDTLKPEPKNIKQEKSMENNYIKPHSRIPKSIRIYFLICHFIFGHNFGFPNLLCRKSSKIYKYFSAVLALTTFFMLAWPFKTLGQTVWYWTKVVECMLNFCILLTTKYTVYNFLSDIHAAERIAVLENETYGFIISIYSLGMLIIKGLMVAMTCIFDNDDYCEMTPAYLSFYMIYAYALDVMHDSQIIIRFYIYVYVKNMERSLKQDHDINKFITRYEKIVHCQDKIRRLCDSTVSIIKYFLG